MFRAAGWAWDTLDQDVNAAEVHAHIVHRTAGVGNGKTVEWRGVSTDRVVARDGYLRAEMLHPRQIASPSPA